MNDRVSEPVKVLVPVGSLGAGVKADEVAFGLERGAQVIACDAGSTDSGAAYLATGKAKYNRGAIRRDLEIMMKAQKSAGVPIIVGSCGQAGGDANLDLVRDIVLELASELDMAPRIAVIRSEQSRETIKALNAAGRTRPLPPLGPLTDAVVDECDHIVAVLGVEPFVEALEAGADIILAGRATDTAVLAAYPVWKGKPWGQAWHAGKIGECGGQCAEDRGVSGALFTVGTDSFDVEPLQASAHCTPHSVSAHMLYENTDPFLLTEPGGVLNVTDARYEAVDARVVRVTGSRWEERPYTMKLEGAGSGQFQTLMLVGIRDPDVLEDIDLFHDRMLAALYDRTRSSIPADELGAFHISLRMYGWNAVTGLPNAPGTALPPEVGMLLVATARTQDLANAIAHACNPYFFHFPAVMDKELPSYGFAFSPADVARGQVYEFKLNHVIEMDDWHEFVRTEWIDLAQPATPTKELSDA